MPAVRTHAKTGSRSTPRVIRNVNYLKRRKRLARWSAIIGLALLGSTFWLLINPSRILLAYAVLFVGMTLFHRGMQQVAKWNAGNDVRLDTLLRSLGDQYTLIHYAQVGNRTIEHLLVYPGGVLVLTAKELPGQVSYRNGRWRKKTGGLSRLFGMGGPQVGDPSRDTHADLATLDARLTEAQLEVETDGAIVFLYPTIEIDVEEPDFPVMNGDGLPEYLRHLPADESLQAGDRQALVALLGAGGEPETLQAPARRRPVKRRAA